MLGATRLKHAQNGRAMTYVLGETWDTGPANYDITYAREFRHDSARQRYLNRALDPAELLATGERVALSDTWSDFDGDEIYGDFEIDGQTITELRSFELGLAKVDPWTTVGGADTSYYHTDMIGTTRFMTDWTGADIDSAVYTAFGERASGTQHRYGYAGAWGYQTHDDLPFLHVGHRYYDPASGRFLQRDPLGIVGGTNVYAYTGSNPVTRTDPSGLGPLDWLYTGQWNPPPGIYDAAVDAAAAWLIGSSPVRGGYAGVGTTGNRGIVAGGGVSWTMDDGGSVWGGVGISGSRRGRDPRTGRFESGTGIIGIGGSWGEGGGSAGIWGGAGRNQKGRGGHVGGTWDGRVNIGINFGIFNCGLILDLGMFF